MSLCFLYFSYKLHSTRTFCDNDKEISQITLTLTVSKIWQWVIKYLGNKNTVTELTEFPRPLSRKENERQPNERKITDKKSLQDDGKENCVGESRERLKNQKRLWNRNLPNEKHLYVYFWKRQSVFSQWFHCIFTVDDITYSSAEQYMMHQKAGKIFCCPSNIRNDNLYFVCFVVVKSSCYPIISYYVNLCT